MMGALLRRLAEESLGRTVTIALLAGLATQLGCRLADEVADRVFGAPPEEVLEWEETPPSRRTW